MQTAERIVMVLLLLVLVGGGAWIYFAVQYEQQEVREAVVRGDYEMPLNTKSMMDVTPDNWRELYPSTVPIVIGTTSVFASVADSLLEQMKGLSDTPFLPDNVVKLFSFGVAAEHSIWMKDMHYSIDIIWVDEDGTIVHIEPDVSPETFPDSFSSPVPAWYVIETNAGFTASNTVTVGDHVVLPK